MIRRVPTVLLAALGAACAGATGFHEIPLPGRIGVLVGACVLAGAVQAVPLQKNL